jgi:hypothetical protein
MYEFCSEQLQSQLQLIRSGIKRYFSSLSLLCLTSLSLSFSCSKKPFSGKPAENGMTRDGKYKLFSIVCHKGRDADSGHYIAYVRDTLVENRWWKFDDNTVTAESTEEVLSLKGGGDKEMIYLCIYRAV